jgi:transcriptional regulator with XRE-family HTH domain
MVHKNGRFTKMQDVHYLSLLIRHNLQQKILELGLSIEELTRRIKLPYLVFHSYFYGKEEMPASLLYEIALFLRVSPDYFFRDSFKASPISLSTAEHHTAH